MCHPVVRCFQFPCINCNLGVNSVVKLVCTPEKSSVEACEAFDVRAQRRNSGNYIGLVTLKKPLDFEDRSSYDMVITAQDSGIPSLSSTANILITFLDIQDQKPFFVNAPYSVSIPENVPAGTAIFEIKGIYNRLPLIRGFDGQSIYHLYLCLGRFLA